MGLREGRCIGPAGAQSIEFTICRQHDRCCEEDRDREAGEQYIFSAAYFHSVVPLISVHHPEVVLPVVNAEVWYHTPYDQAIRRDPAPLPIPGPGAQAQGKDISRKRPQAHRSGLRLPPLSPLTRGAEKKTM